MIAGPIGIVMANAMLGEITPRMAEAVASADVPILLIPMSRCSAQVMGTGERKLADNIRETADRIARLCG